MKISIGFVPINHHIYLELAHGLLMKIGRVDRIRELGGMAIPHNCASNYGSEDLGDQSVQIFGK